MSSYYQQKKLALGRDFIADNLAQPFCLDTIAQSAHLSPYHFVRAFKQHYGQTPNQFSIQQRIKMAKALLITENFTVAEVCENVGYTSLGSFSSLFTKEVGMSPSLYRRKLWAMSTQPFRFPVQAIPSCYGFHFLGKKP